MMLLDAVRIDQCYSSQFYDLSALKKYQAPMVELGRFCTHPEYPLDPDLLRVAWGAITAFVDVHAVELMFGCSSFAGTDPDPYLDCFALLNERHLASNDYMPAVKGTDVFSFSGLQDHKPDVAQAMRTMPPLLRSYLLMGGWVSDHAIVAHVMTTLHVFTGVEVRAIPDARKRLLRAVVG
jgi:putative hemolysin